MDLQDTKPWNDCAGEGQQQLNRPNFEWLYAPM
jgi:hypothetical protein